MYAGGAVHKHKFDRRRIILSTSVLKSFVEGDLPHKLSAISAV
jgi:hypothetical protein